MKQEIQSHSPRLAAKCLVLVLLLASAIAALPVATSAKSTAATEQDAVQAPPLKVEANEVVLDLVVRGRDGHLVRNLKPQDVMVYENGVRQTLRSLQLLTSEHPSGPTTGAAPVPGEQRYSGPLHLVVIALDDLRLESSRRARDAADALLNLPMPERTYYAVALIEPKLRIVQGFTRDAERLKAAVAAAASRSLLSTAPAQFALPTSPSGATSSGPRAAATDAKLREIERHIRDTDEEIQSGQQLGALVALVGGLREESGRKTVLLFCEGIHRYKDSPMYRSLVSAANLANVSFYMLDAGGLGIETSTGVGELSIHPEWTAGSIPNPAVIEDNWTSRPKISLWALAADTGGLVISDTNDLRTRMNEVIEDAFSYWIATYAPANTDWNGGFREIKVQLKPASLKVQSRSGYFALPPDMRDVLLPYEVPLLKALGQTPPPKQFDFRMAAFRFRPGGESTQVVVDFEAPLAGLSVHQDQKQKTFEAKAAFLMLVKNADGRVVRKVHREVPFSSRLDRLAEYQAGNFIFNDSFSLPPGRYTIEGAVTDRLDNRVAVKRSVLTIPAHGPGLQMGSLLVVRRVEDLPAEEKNVAVPDDDPLRISAGKVKPALNPKLKSGPDAQLSLYIALYPDASIRATPTLRLECVREGMTALSANLPVPAQDASGRIAAVLQVPVGALPAGRYDVLVRAQQGTSAAEERVTVELE